MKELLEAQIKKLEAEVAQLKTNASTIHIQREKLGAALEMITNEIVSKEGGLTELKKVLEELNGTTESDSASKGV